MEIYKEVVELDEYVYYLWRLYLLLIQHISYRLFSQLVQSQLAAENSSKESIMTINSKIDSNLRKLEHTNFLKRRGQAIDSMPTY